MSFTKARAKASLSLIISRAFFKGKNQRRGNEMK
jgi:hypothetical protein